MKILYPLLAGSLLLVACQRQPETKTLVAAAPATSESTVAAKPVAPVKTAPEGETLTSEMLAFLKENDLATLWQNDVESRRENPTLQGFFGNDHYAIAFVFTHVLRDDERPNVFHVQGKSRYKKRITPFDGLLTVTQIADLSTYLDLDSVEEANARAYTVKASFIFRQDSTIKNAGVYRGTGLLDMYRTQAGKIDQCLIYGGEDNPTKGRGLQFEGEWVSNATGQRKPLLLSNDVFAIAPMVLKNFGIGERGGEINPKYAKLGWVEIWENDEWWAEPGTAVAKAQP